MPAWYPTVRIARYYSQRPDRLGDLSLVWAQRTLTAEKAELRAAEDRARRS